MLPLPPPPKKNVLSFLPSCKRELRLPSRASELARCSRRRRRNNAVLRASWACAVGVGAAERAEPWVQVVAPPFGSERPLARDGSLTKSRKPTCIATRQGAGRGCP